MIKIFLTIYIKSCKTFLSIFFSTELFKTFFLILLYSGSYYVTLGIAEVKKTLCFSSTADTDGDREGGRKRSRETALNGRRSVVRPTSDVASTARDL